MMGRFRDQSICTKLVLLAVGSVLIALSLCSLGTVAIDIKTMQAAKVRELHVLAEVLGFNSREAIFRRQGSTARRLLESLQREPTVQCGCLYDASGKVMAYYSRDGQTPPPLPKTKAEADARNSGRGLELFYPIVEDDGRPHGTIYLRSSLSDYHADFDRHVAVTVAVMVLSLGVAVLFAMRLQRSIAAPILDLAEIAQKVGADNDYSVRAKHETCDEVGGLCQAFNGMLAQIESSEAALRAAQDELEDRVQERTAQLESEIERRREAQADLEQARDDAEAASRAKSQFLANMSHEIRTPLNAILGFTDLLRRGADGGDKAEQRDFIDTIRASGEHLLCLINDILDLSRIEADHLEVERVACSPNEIIAEMVSVLRVRAQEKGLSLDLQWMGPMPAAIQTDPFRLRQLLVNLLGNAVKFTARGGVTVTARLLAERSQLEIAVADTGVGIPADKLADIFDPFVQADNSVTREFGGSGLGLAISRRIVEALGGSIDVQSEVGRGSVFTVTLDTGPLAGVELLEPGATDGVAHSQTRSSPETVNLPPASILLVEDGVTNRKLIGLILRRAGARVITAENGQVAVELAGQHAFDLVLMDMQMPIMDGYTAATRLRQQGITVPIIALTAHAMKGDVEKCLAAGCSGYLSKPVKPETLLRTVSEALGVEDQSPPQDNPTPEERIVSSLPADDEDFREIVEDYVVVLGQQVASMRQSWEARDVESLRRQSHRLKGTAGTAGFNQFTAPARRLEQLARNACWDEADRLIDQIAEMARRIWLPWRDPAERGV